MKTIYSIIFALLAISIHAQELKLSDINSPEYGQGTSIGVSILGDGLAGLQLRHVLGNEDQLELNTTFWNVAVSEISSDDIVLFNGVFFRAGYNFHLGNNVKEKKGKRKFRKNYLSVKPGLGFARVNAQSIALTWHKEMFFVDQPQSSKGIDLGLQFIHFTNNRTGYSFGDSYSIFLRFDWAWFRGGK